MYPSSVTITLGGIALNQANLDKQLPLPQYEIMTKDHYMSEGTGGSGFKVVQFLGVYYKDFDFNISYLTRNQLSQIESLVLAENVINLVITSTGEGSFSETYKVYFKDFQPFLSTLAEYNVDVYGCQVTLGIIDKV